MMVAHRNATLGEICQTDTVTTNQRATLAKRGTNSAVHRTTSDAEARIAGVFSEMFILGNVLHPSVHQRQAQNDVFLSCVFYQNSSSIWPQGFKKQCFNTRKEPRFCSSAVVTLGRDYEGVAGIVERPINAYCLQVEEPNIQCLDCVELQFAPVVFDRLKKHRRCVPLQPKPLLHQASSKKCRTSQ